MQQQGVPDRDPGIASFVRERRRRSGLTQHELGDLAGVGHRFIVELERGKATLRLDKVNQVLAVFGSRLGPVTAPPDAGTARAVSPEDPASRPDGTTT